VLDATGGFAAVLDFVGTAETVSFGMSVLRKGGRLVLVGLFGGALSLALPVLPLRGISLIGSFVGSLAELRKLVALARAGKLREIPVETRPLADAQKTLDDLRGSRVIGRAILKP
jgi:D-arabinose 1-dehydrogenase-like Zn-dependent alcohol dehydrogenase